MMIKETLSRFGRVGWATNNRPYMEVTTDAGHIYKVVHSQPEPEIGIIHFIYFVNEQGVDGCFGSSEIQGNDIYAHWYSDATTIAGKHGWMNAQPDFISFADVWVIQQYEKFLEQEFDKSMDAAKKLLEGVD